MLWFALMLSFLACVFLVMKQYVEMEMDRIRMRISVYDGLISTGRIWGLGLEILLTMLHPYPWLVGEGTVVANPIIGLDIYYNINDFFNMISLVRIIWIFPKMINFTIWKSNSAQRICMMYGCQADMMFGVKSIMKMYPISFLFIVLICGALYFSILLKYCEAPVNRVAFTNQNDLYRLDNCLWLIIVTMTTVGYGDTYPRTLLGRISIFFCAIFGVTVVSVMVVAIQNTLMFTLLEEKAYTCINKLSSRKKLLTAAAKMISRLLILNRRPPENEKSALNEFQRFKELSLAFIKNTRRYKSIYDNDFSNEFFRQFDLLKEMMKELTFFLSVLAKVIFNDQKYSDLTSLNTDDLLSIDLLLHIKDRKEMAILKEQHIINNKGDLLERIAKYKEELSKNPDHNLEEQSDGIEKKTTTYLGRQHTMSPRGNSQSARERVPEEFPATPPHESKGPHLSGRILVPEQPSP